MKGWREFTRMCCEYGSIMMTLLLGAAVVIFLLTGCATPPSQPVVYQTADGSLYRLESGGKIVPVQQLPEDAVTHRYTYPDFEVRIIEALDQWTNTSR